MKKELFFIVPIVAAFSICTFLHPLEIELKERKKNPLLKKETSIKLAKLYSTQMEPKVLTCFLKKRPTFLKNGVAQDLILLKNFYAQYQKYKRQNNDWRLFYKETKKITFPKKLKLLNFFHQTCLSNACTHILFSTIQKDMRKKPWLSEVYKKLIQENSFQITHHSWEKVPRALFFGSAKNLEPFLSDDEKISFLWSATAEVWRFINIGSYSIACKKVNKTDSYSKHRLIHVFNQDARKIFSLTIKNKDQLFINKEYFAGISSYHQINNKEDSLLDPNLEQHKVPAFFIDLRTNIVNKIEEPICFYDSPMVYAHQDQLLFFWPKKIFSIDMGNGLKTIINHKKETEYFHPFAQKNAPNVFTFYSYKPPSVVKSIVTWLISSLTMVPFNFDNLKTYTGHTFKITKKNLTLDDYLKKFIKKDNTQQLTVE